MTIPKKNCLVTSGVKRGFTTIEMILALVMIGILMPLMTQMVSMFSLMQYESYSQLEDQVGIEQLRIYLAGGIILDKSNSEVLYLKTKKDTYRIKEVNNKLLMQEGSLTFLNGISNLEFYIEGDFEMMRYQKKGQTYETWIGFPQ